MARLSGNWHLRHRIVKKLRHQILTFTLKQLDAPEVDGVTYDEVIEAGEHLSGMAALWDVATVEERYEMVTIILDPGGLYMTWRTR